jgi:hypothetical protein
MQVHSTAANSRNTNPKGKPTENKLKRVVAVDAVIRVVSLHGQLTTPVNASLRGEGAEP